MRGYAYLRKIISAVTIAAFVSSMFAAECRIPFLATCPTSMLRPQATQERTQKAPSDVLVSPRGNEHENSGIEAPPAIFKNPFDKFIAVYLLVGLITENTFLTLTGMLFLVLRFWGYAPFSMRNVFARFLNAFVPRSVSLINKLMGLHIRYSVARDAITFEKGRALGNNPFQKNTLIAHLHTPTHNDIRTILRELRSPDGAWARLYAQGYRRVYFPVHSREVRNFLLHLTPGAQRLYGSRLNAKEQDYLTRNRQWFQWFNQLVLLWPGELLEESELYYLDLDALFSGEHDAEDETHASPLIPLEVTPEDA
jgi:hypothetical protein